jgi:hypothetical protein
MRNAFGAVHEERMGFKAIAAVTADIAVFGSEETADTLEVEAAGSSETSTLPHFPEYSSF